MLPPDMIKEKELSLDRLERIAVSHGIRVSLAFPTIFSCSHLSMIYLNFSLSPQAIQKMIEVCGRARHGDAEVTRLTAKNDILLGENNKPGENFKLRDAAMQLG